MYWKTHNYPWICLRYKDKRETASSNTGDTERWIQGAGETPEAKALGRKTWTVTELQGVPGGTIWEGKTPEDAVPGKGRGSDTSVDFIAWSLTWSSHNTRENFPLLLEVSRALCSPKQGLPSEGTISPAVVYQSLTDFRERKQRFSPHQPSCVTQGGGERGWKAPVALTVQKHKLTRD